MSHLRSLHQSAAESVVHDTQLFSFFLVSVVDVFVPLFLFLFATLIVLVPLVVLILLVILYLFFVTLS